MTVLGTLAGALIAAVVAVLLQRATRAHTHRADALTALAQLAKAIADHRRAMWTRETTRLRLLSQITDRPGDANVDTNVNVDVDVEEDPIGEHPRMQAVNEASHATRSEITAPLILVQVLLPGLAETAEAAVQATYDMHNALDLPRLRLLREKSLATVNALTVAGAAAFAEPRHRARPRLRLRRGAVGGRASGCTCRTSATPSAPSTL